MADYFKQLGGDHFFQSTRTGIKTCLFMTGCKMAELPETRYAARRYIEEFSPADYFVLHRYISDTFTTANAEILATHLVLCCFDPYMLHRLIDRLCSLVPETSRSTVEYLAHSIDTIANNFYYMPGTFDSMYDIAQFYYTLQWYDHALYYYKKSMALFGPNANSQYYAGICEQHGSAQGGTEV